MFSRTRPRDSGDVSFFFSFPFFLSPFWLSSPFFFLLRVDENKNKKGAGVFILFFISLILSYERPGGREERE